MPACVSSSAFSPVHRSDDLLLCSKLVEMACAESMEEL